MESRLSDTSQQLPRPREIGELYELHSEKSVAVNELLMNLEAASKDATVRPLWEEAIRVNSLSMWLHQVLAFEYALGQLRRCARQSAREQGRKVPRLARQPESRCQDEWPRNSSALKVHSQLREVGSLLGLDSDAQFRHEITVAPRHYIWRDAWVHRGGRLREYHQQTYEYFEQRGVLTELNGCAWPRDPAWSEARLSFRKLVEPLVRCLESGPSCQPRCS